MKMTILLSLVLRVSLTGCQVVEFDGRILTNEWTPDSEYEIVKKRREHSIPRYYYGRHHSYAYTRPYGYPHYSSGPYGYYRHSYHGYSYGRHHSYAYARPYGYPHYSSGPYGYYRHSYHGYYYGRHHADKTHRHSYQGSSN